MKDKIIFWSGFDFTQFCMGYYFQKKYDCDMYSIIDITDATKTFFEEQKLVNFKKIWFIHDQYSNSNIKPDLEYLKNFEKKYQINLWQLIFNERIFYGFFNFHTFSSDEMLSIVEQICKFYERIFEDIKPDYFITKLTAFHHLELFRRMCIAKGVKVLMLSNPKIPKKTIISEDDTRIDYVKNLDDFLSEFHSIEEVQNDYAILTNNVVAKQLVAEFWKNHGSSSILKTIKIFFKYIFSHNSNVKTHYNYYGMTKYRVIKNFIILRIKKKIRENFINRKLSKNILTDIPFVFFPLSVVLERHILIGAPYSINQTELIKHIAKSLPIGYRLIVKEHPAQSSREWRKISEYNEILEIPNTFLLHPNSDDEFLIKNASLIISTAGSIGFQSAFHGKPCLVFGDVLYSYLSSVNKIDSLDNLPNLIKNSLEIKPDPSELSRYIRMLKDNLIDFDFIQFLKDFNHEFAYDGGFVDVKIDEYKMKKFIEKNKNSLENLANAHIKKIFQHKNYN